MTDMAKVKRITVKVGTSTLTHSTGRLNLKRLEQLARVLSDIANSGIQVILVSSGAIGVGVSKLGLLHKPSTIPEKQAAAAVGQSELMTIYDKFFSEYHYNVAQVLLTKDITENEERRANVINTFDTLLKFNSIPIVNENDTVSTEEILFGDNDTLSAIVATLTKSDLLVLLTDINGLYDKNPRENKDAKLIPVVTEITDEMKENACSVGSKFGTGGMITKLSAAEIAMNEGIKMVIADGSHPKIIYDIIDGKQVGTVFLPKSKAD